VALKAFCPGIFPRSEALVQATRDLDRGRTTKDAVDGQIAGDLAQLVEVQQSAGIDLLTDGMLRWQDLFRPFVDEAEGLERGALTRFLDTNTFYRAPAATTATPRLASPLGEEYVAPLPGPRVVTLPSPWALGQGTGVPAKTIAADVLKPQLETLDAELVVLSEPFLARHGASELEELAPALEALSGGSTPVAIQFTFCDARELLEAGAADLPVDGIGIDFYSTHLTDFPEGFGKLLLAGVVDARNSVLEEPRELAAFAERLRSERGAEQIALTPNGDLQYVSQQIAHEKVRRLGKAKTASTEAAA
jgi:5-methyltetrahydropteroyltriglutamate--homocysteine methyltransferase